MKAMLRILPCVLLGLFVGCHDLPTEDASNSPEVLLGKGGNKPPKDPPGGGEVISLTGTDLGTLGGDMVQVEGISPEGWIVGYADTEAGPALPFLWREGVMEPLPLPDRFVPLPGNEGYTSAVIINGIRMMAGAAPDPDRPDGSGGFFQTPLIWTMAAEDTLIVQELPVPSPAPGSVQPRAINDAGVIVASVRDPNYRPITWNPITETWSPLAEPAGALFTWASDLNESGVIVGYSRMDDWGVLLFDALVWKPSSLDPVVLPTYENSEYQRAWAITEAGDIVGEAVTQTHDRVAVRWRPANDGIYATVERIDGLERARDINGCDQIAGEAFVRDADGTLYQPESLFRRGDIWDLRINDSGWIVGTSAARVKGPGPATKTRGTLWTLPSGC